MYWPFSHFFAKCAVCCAGAIFGATLTRHISQQCLDKTNKKAYTNELIALFATSEVKLTHHDDSSNDDSSNVTTNPHSCQTFAIRFTWKIL